MTKVQKMDKKSRLERFEEEMSKRDQESLVKITQIIVYPDLSTTKFGFKVQDTYINLKFLLDQFGIVIRYNLMNRRHEILIPSDPFFDEDKDTSSLFYIEHLAKKNLLPHRDIKKHIHLLAVKNVHHPIVECIKNKPWDKIDRLDNFIRTTIKTSNPDLDFVIIKTWMMAAIAAAHALQKGFTNHGVLVLQGKQGIGKTEWVRKLDPLDGVSVKTGAILDPKSKDSIIGLARFWIVELGELDGTFNKSDIAQLKSFITSAGDDVRIPYGHTDINFIRRTAYIATVNEPKFLVDETGNRRWWTICAEEIDYRHDFDMQQIWAEAKFLLDSGAATYLLPEIQSKVDEINKDHEMASSVEELLLTRYDWNNSSRRRLTATDILIELGFLKPNRSECIKLGNALIKKNGKKAKKSDGVMLHDIPNLLSFNPFCPT